MKTLEAFYDNNLYFYNGFAAPEQVEKVSELIVVHSLQGDKTDLLTEELVWCFKNWDENDIIQEQPFCEFGIWYKPTKEILLEYDQTIGLNGEHLS